MTEFQFEMLTNIEQYYNDEYISITRVVNGTLDRTIFTPAEIVRNTLQRMLGVALFAQKYLSYDDVNTLYEEYKTKIENLT